MCITLQRKLELKKDSFLHKFLQGFFFTPYVMLFIELLLCYINLFCNTITLHIYHVVMYLFFLYR